MEYINKYIPREYLALKINYCRQQLTQLPKVSMQEHNSSGTSTKRIVIGNHRYNLNSPMGKKCFKIWIARDELERQLQIYEAIWYSNFKGEPFPECKPHKVVRTMNVTGNKQVILNKAYFDSLENDANTEHTKYQNYYFNGIYYRSAAEHDIAVFYTEAGIPFKYEPKIMLAGLDKPVNTDFVLYIKELDNCKFHEHLGIKDSSDYQRITKLKYGNYTNAGLIPEQDIIFTYDVYEMPFDIRYFSAKLNTVIYGTTICSLQQYDQNRFPENSL